MKLATIFTCFNSRPSYCATAVPSSTFSPCTVDSMNLSDHHDKYSQQVPILRRIPKLRQIQSLTSCVFPPSTSSSDGLSPQGRQSCMGVGGRDPQILGWGS